MIDDGDRQLPPTVARLWHGGVAGRRGPKPALSVEAIVQAAVDIADADGLATVSMARIGDALGCTSMALYRHVAGKDELLVLMSDAVGGLMALPDIDGVGWRAGLERWTTAQIDAMVARPWVLDLPLSAILPGPRRMAWIDAGFAIMADVDLPFVDKLAVLGLLGQFVLGEARVQVESTRTAAAIVCREAGLDDSTPAAELDPEALEAANPYAGFETLLMTVAGPDRFPHIGAAVAAADPADLAEDPQFGLQVVLDGIEAYIVGGLRRRES